MTKEEFERMVDSELDKLQAQARKENDLIIYYEKLLNTNLNSIEFEEKLEQAKYNLQMIKHTIEELDHFLQYPIYARIQTMSDLEIEEYRQLKLDECEEKKETLHTEKNSLVKKLEETYREREDTILKIANNVIGIEKGIQVEERIKNISSRINMIESELIELDHQIGVFRKESPQAIKMIAINQQPFNFYFLYRTNIGFNRNNLKIENPHDAQKLAHLLSERSKINSSYPNKKSTKYWYESIEFWDDLLHPRSTNLFDELYMRANEYGYKSLVDVLSKYRNFTIEYESDLDEIDKVILKFEGAIKSSEKDFNKKFNEEIISRFKEIGKMEDGFEAAVKLYDLMRDNDLLIIKDDSYNIIDQYYKEMKSLKGKIIKNSRIKERIQFLFDEIRDKLAEIGIRIYIGYDRVVICENIRLKIIPESNLIKFLDLYHISADLSIEFHKIFSDSIKIVEKIKELLQESREYYHNFELKKNNDLNKNEEEIRKIVGSDFDLFISNNSLFSDNSLDQQQNYNAIMLSSSQNKINEFLNKVDTEAQNQADIREAELLGISLEELRKKKAPTDDSQFDEVNSSYVPTSRKK